MRKGGLENREREREGCARLFRIEGLVDGPVDPIERHDKREMEEEEEEEEEVRIGRTEVALFPRFLLRLSYAYPFASSRASVARARHQENLLLPVSFISPPPHSSRFLSAFSLSFTLRSPRKKRSRREKYPEGEMASRTANLL